MYIIKKIHELVRWMTYKKIEKTVDAMNEKWITCSVSILPVESYSTQEWIIEKDKYIALIDALSQKNEIKNTHNNITIKLYQINQFNDYKNCRQIFFDILDHAKQKNVFIWLDTSDRTTKWAIDIIDQTLSLFNEAIKIYWKEQLWICLQAYLKRTYNDFVSLHNQWVTIRLVNWFYNNYTIKSRKDTKKQFLECAIYGLNNKKWYVAFATHDQSLIEKLEIYIQNWSAIKNYGFQWFIDVNNNFFEWLKKKWYDVTLYIPYWNFQKFLTRWWRTMDKKRWIMRILWIKVW